MKIISDLQIALTKESFYNDQFKFSEKKKKHILFLTCNLSAKDLYTKILPFMSLYNEHTSTAMINLDKYGPEEQLTDINMYFQDINEFIWADFVVIPFTIKPLKKFFTKLKEINPQCKIIFWIDYNFYELPENHHLKKHFTPEAINNIEENIWNSDICRVSQQGLHQYLVTKLNELATTKFSGIPTNVILDLQPLLINQEIVLANVDYNPQTPKKVKKIAPEDKPKETTKPTNLEEKAVETPPKTITDPRIEKKIKAQQELAKAKLEAKAGKEQTQKIEQTIADTKKIIVWFENDKWVLKKSKTAPPFLEYENKVDAIKEGHKHHKQGNNLIVYTKEGKVHFQKNVRKNAKTK